MPEPQGASWIVAITGQKGGVGKSTLAMALASAVADSAGRALVVDVDPQATTVEEVEKLSDPGFDVVHELDPRKLAQLSRLRDYDLILVDTPGSLEGHDVLRQVVDNAHFALIPYVNESPNRKPTERTSALIAQAGVPHAAVINRIDPRSGGDAVIEARKQLDQRTIFYFKSFVREYKGFPDSLDAGKTVYQWRARYGANMREDVSRVQAELQRSLGRIASGV